MGFGSHVLLRAPPSADPAFHLRN